MRLFWLMKYLLGLTLIFIITIILRVFDLELKLYVPQGQKYGISFLQILKTLLTSKYLRVKLKSGFR